jgi:hypothetical protein
MRVFALLSSKLMASGFEPEQQEATNHENGLRGRSDNPVQSVK